METISCLFFFLDYSTLCSQVIAEGANGPTTPEAEKVLIENKKLVIPVSLQRKQQVQSEVNLDHEALTCVCLS